MATKKRPPAKPQPAISNREQRRREKFGNAGNVHQHNPLGPWPESEANPALKVVIGDEATQARSPDQGVPDQSGAGTGGATETAAKAPAVEGAKPRAKPKG